MEWILTYDKKLQRKIKLEKSCFVSCSSREIDRYEGAVNCDEKGNEIVKEQVQTTEQVEQKEVKLNTKKHKNNE